MPPIAAEHDDVGRSELDTIMVSEAWTATGQIIPAVGISTCYLDSEALLNRMRLVWHIRAPEAFTISGCMKVEAFKLGVMAKLVVTPARERIATYDGGRAVGPRPARKSRAGPCP